MTLRNGSARYNLIKISSVHRDFALKHLVPAQRGQAITRHHTTNKTHTNVGS